MTTFTGVIHRFAAMYPLMDDDRLLALAEHIAEHGLIDPITLNTDGDLVDGRNRLRGCDIAGVEPRFVVVDLPDDEAVAGYVQGRNSERRDLSPGQHAMSRAMLLAAQGRRKNGRWERGSLDNGQLSDSAGDLKLMAKAGLVLDWTPDLPAEVMAGTLSLDAAYKTAQEEQQKSTEAERAAKALAAQKKMLADRRPDLAKRVEAGHLQFEEALMIFKKDQDKKDRLERLYREKVAHQNTELHAGYATLMSMGNADIRAEMEKYYEPGVTNITGQKLKELADMLSAISGTWRVGE